LELPHDAIFGFFSEYPVAAASLGQVYKGKLCNTDVATKVQRPGLIEYIAFVMRIIRGIASFFEKFLDTKINLIFFIDEYTER